MTAIPLNQGAPKTSEIALLSQQPVLGTDGAINDDLDTAFSLAIGIGADAIRRTAYIFNSSNPIQWANDLSSLPAILLNDGVNPSSMIMTLLQNEPGFPAAINLVMQGLAPAGTPDATHFLNIEMANLDMIYLEVNRSVLQASGGTVIIQNAINGGSVVSGQTLRKVNLGSGGMPSILNQSGVSPATATLTQTVYMPIAYRYDNPLTSNPLIWWVPHGIMWPFGVNSNLGAVITSGFTTYPTLFVANQTQLLTAVGDLSGTGGVICFTAGFTINSTITIPQNVVLIGRDLVAPVVLTGGGQLLFSSPRCRMYDMYLSTAANLTMVSLSGSNYTVIERCRFSAPPAGSAICIDVASSGTDISDCEFNGVTYGSTSTAIQYEAGFSENTRENNIFTS